MENACYYTFSTICQTLAGAFGFLVAVVLYRLKEISDEIGAGVYHAKMGRGLDNNADFMRAIQESDWPEVAKTLRVTGFTGVDHLPEQHLKGLDRQRDRFVYLVDQVGFMRRGLCHALTLTGWTIFLSLLALWLSPAIAKAGFFTWIALAVSWLFAGACLTTYYDLAKGVAE